MTFWFLQDPLHCYYVLRIESVSKTYISFENVVVKIVLDTCGVNYLWCHYLKLAKLLHS